MPYFQINGQNIFYQDSGTDQPPLLFLHGFLFDQTMFDAQVAFLSDKYRCIRVDTRGFGQTEWDGEAFTLYDVVDDCIGLLDHLNIDSVNLVGMSQGGYASLRFAHKHPERVTSMILMSTRGDITPAEFEENYRALRDHWYKNGASDVAIESLMSVLIGPPDQQAAHWANWKARWAAFPGINMYHTVNALLSRKPLSSDDLAQIKQPVLSVHGMADLGTPALLADMLYESLPNQCGKVRIAGAAHSVSMTHADVVNPFLEQFLANHSA